jgi:hypothetical protein
LQERLFELAVNPGRLKVRRVAAHALLAASDHVMESVLALVTPQILVTRDEAVTSRLLLLLAVRGEIGVVIKAAETLATNERRRVLLLLAIWILRDRDLTAAERIAVMLPKDHMAVAWVLGRDIGKFRDQMLDDLGDPLSVEQVLQFMNRKSKKT